MGFSLIASPQRSSSPELNSFQTLSNRAEGLHFEVAQRRKVVLGSCAYPTHMVSLDVSGVASINVPTPNTVATSLLHCCLAAPISLTIHIGGLHFQSHHIPWPLLWQKHSHSQAISVQLLATAAQSPVSQ